MTVPDALRALIGRSTSMEQVRSQIRCIAPAPIPVLIIGETGTGKASCEQAIARLSGRAPIVPVNCAALPDSLAESELFGHERGAFTGAIRCNVGVIATANGGILFLDELVDLSSPLQAKLLRALETGEYRPVGSTTTRRSDFRIIAATSGGLERIRPELLHRIGAVRVILPPLRRRPEDIPLLATEFLRCYRERARRGPFRIARETYVMLMQETWPGNVRQLRNVIEGAAALAGTDNTLRVLQVSQVIAPDFRQETEPDCLSLVQIRRRSEQRAILNALERVSGNRERAARLLRISPATLYRKLQA